MWYYIKILYCITFVFSNLIYSNFIFNKISRLQYKEEKSKNTELKQNNRELSLLVGYDINTKQKIYIPESGLYQNFLITGTIGSGKTSSAMYPFTNQLMRYNSQNRDKKIGMLILDVKGNYYAQVKKYAEKYDLLNDLTVIELGSSVNYNPLHKAFPFDLKKVCTCQIPDIFSNNLGVAFVNIANRIIFICS